MNQAIVDELQRMAPERRLTLARHVLDLPTLADRRAWIDDYAKRHGPVAVAELRDDMLDEAKRRKGARP